MFISLNTTRSTHADARFQCICGTEYRPAQSRTCPACGKRIPRAVSINDAPWKSYLEFRIDNLKQMLTPDVLSQLPQEHHDALRKNIARQIRELEDGSWKSTAKDRIRLLRQMLTPDALNKVSSEEQADMQKHLESQVQRLQEELAACGDGASAPVDLPAPTYATGIFTPPRVTRREWNEDPLHVAQKISAALALHLQPQNMSPDQRHLLFAFYYLQSLEGGGFGELLFNAAENPSDNSLPMIREALHALAAPAHIDLLDRALARWNEKPRPHTAPPRNDKPALERWLDETFTPLRAEFHDLNEDARTLRPSLESRIISFLQTHQPDFVTLTDTL